MKKPQGALVSKVLPGSPAEKAGLQIGDIITEFNGQQIETSGDLPPMVGMTPINDKATLTVIRQGETKSIDFKIGLLADETNKSADVKATPKLPQNRLGVNIIDLTDAQREALQIAKNGVLVQDVAKGSTAKDAGIQRGDVILRIQNNIIRDAADFDKIVKKLPIGKSVAILIQRQGNPVFLAIKIEK
jgi:serine protease Do